MILTEEQQMIREAIRSFAQEQLAPLPKSGNRTRSSLVMH